MQCRVNIILNKDNHGYFVHCPELPGCHSQGDTFEEAMIFTPCIPLEGGSQRASSGEGEEDSVNRLTVELSAMQYIVLDQNVPNPFAEQTSISYFIPEERTTVSKAQIVFFDLSGRIIKTADIEKGYGIITVFAPNLSSGTYSYSLLIDGKAVETKKMVKMR